MTGQQSDMGFPDNAKPKKTRSKAVMPRNTKRFERRGIQVTETDITRSIMGNSHSCMIAEAIKREIPGAKNVKVDVQSISFTDTERDRRISCITPPPCQFGLILFDKGLPIKPFSFNLKAFQVMARTRTVPKLDENGQPIKKTRTVQHTRKDGTVTTFTTQEGVRDAVEVPSQTKVQTHGNNRGDWGAQQIAGGKMPPRHLPSLNRRYGLKAFTWEDHERPELVAQRLGAAWGNEPTHGAADASADPGAVGILPTPRNQPKLHLAPSSSVEDQAPPAPSSSVDQAGQLEDQAGQALADAIAAQHKFAAAIQAMRRQPRETATREGDHS